MSMMDTTSSYDSQSQPQQWFPPGSADGNSSSSTSLGLNMSSLTVSPTHGYHAHQQHHHNQPHHPQHQRMHQQQQQQYPSRPFPLRITTSTSSSSINSSGSGSSSAPPSRKRSFTSNPSSASAGPSSAVLPSASTPGANESDPNEPPESTPTFGNAGGGDMDMDNDFSSMPPSSAVSTTTSATFLGTPSGGASPIDGNNSGSGGDDDGNSGGLFGGSGNGNGGSGGMREGPGILGGVGGIMGMLGKPMPTNNFVTKLYQMINDPKSAHFITWNELGTSFVVSNVGEFSRSILGSHFKHNNFSSFVRQLNMYGFHKINRTPRAQRTSTDAQTWEFSHHKFLRGRPDLLDEIKRKALEPDPGVKQRVELPGEVAAQLNTMRDDNRRMWDQLNAERRKVERLVGVVNRLWDFVGKGFPGSIPPFPLNDLLDNSSLPIPSTTVPSSTSAVSSSSNPNPSINGTGNNAGSDNADNPNIYITSPTATTPAPRFGPGAGAGGNHFGMNMSPGSSPTTMDFPSHIHGHGQMSSHQPFHHQHQQHHAHQQHHQPHHLSRQHNFPLNSFGSRSGSPHPNNEQGDGGGNGPANVNDMFEDGSMSSSSSVMSPTGGGGDGDGPGDGPGQTITGRGSTKRQRMSTSVDDLPSFGHSHHGHMGVGVHGVVGGVGSPYQQQSPLQSPQQVQSQSQPFLSPPDSKKFSTRARSDSAPLGYGGMGMGGGAGAGGSALSPWSGPGGSGILGRPRSGSGLLQAGHNRMMRGAMGSMPGNGGGQGLGLQMPSNTPPGGQPGR
ncbi:hypothetical protein PQX77_008986 [Marasmius sp. AFHP31]|nr:hypothetical protein PQX77_008986 [Marasmius sp. AFHP31]